MGGRDEEMTAEDQYEEWNERAAIIEFESGEHISRFAAETLAAKYLKLSDADLIELRKLDNARP